MRVLIAHGSTTLLLLLVLERHWLRTEPETRRLGLIVRGLIAPVGLVQLLEEKVEGFVDTVACVGAHLEVLGVELLLDLLDSGGEFGHMLLDLLARADLLQQVGFVPDQDFGDLAPAVVVDLLEPELGLLQRRRGGDVEDHACRLR